MYDCLKLSQEVAMTLQEFFVGKKRGAKDALAKELGISRTWMSQIISGREVCSPELAVEIERLTNGEVTRRDLRPDLFGEVA
jgi:DNA-binding transcriptional regulator YdaS (Cro superfamily)